MFHFIRSPLEFKDNKTKSCVDEKRCFYTTNITGIYSYESVRAFIRYLYLNRILKIFRFKCMNGNHTWLTLD
jgi:hypothetical protein